jgi:hypothetical protein
MLPSEALTEEEALDRLLQIAATVVLGGLDETHQGGDPVESTA